MNVMFIKQDIFGKVDNVCYLAFYQNAKCFNVWMLIKF